MRKWDCSWEHWCCLWVGSCWVFIANTFFSPHQQSVLQSTTFRPGCPSHFQVSFKVLENGWGNPVETSCFATLTAGVVRKKVLTDVVHAALPEFLEQPLSVWFYMFSCRRCSCPTRHNVAKTFRLCRTTTHKHSMTRHEIKQGRLRQLNFKIVLTRIISIVRIPSLFSNKDNRESHDDVV